MKLGSIFSNPQAMQLAGLAVLNGKDIGEAVTEGLTQTSLMKRQQMIEQDYQRQQQIREALPALAKDIDLNNPQQSFINLASKVGPEAASGLFKSLVDIQQEQRLKEQGNQLTPYQRESLALQRESLNHRETPTVPVGYRYKSDGSLEPIPGGPADQKAQGKQLPRTVLNEISTNQGALNKVNNGLDLVEKTPQAFGLDNYVTFDRLAKPENLMARAAIADIGSQIVHDRSGAAVTVSEYPRLKPFIPQATDSPKQVKVKLQQLQKGIKEITNGYLTIYETQGYNVKGLEDAGGSSSAVNDQKTPNIAPPTAQEIEEYKKLKGLK